MGKFYITTTIPYVNAPPHIGHALEFVQADVIARFKRLEGDCVYFLSGSDENAIKNVQAAEKEGIETTKLVERNANAFKKLLSDLNISINQFIRTSEDRHKIGAQALWEATKKDLYKKKYSGLYCYGCEAFYREEELNDKKECFEHPGKNAEVIEEENYFFKLSLYSDWIYKTIESDVLKITPKSRKNEVLSFIKKGLEDFSVSRPVSRTKNWGVPVPNDENQTMYVWYDALANYITALGYPDQNSELFKEFWVENNNKCHILGKGVSRFHAIYWLAMLKSAGIPIPNEEFIHGYVTVSGQKVSKTLGNVIDPFYVIEKHGADSLRYYLLREIPAYEDGDFNEKKFNDRYNADLANGLGNFSARILTLASDYDKINFSEDDIDESIKKEILKTKKVIKEKINEYKFHEALIFLWDLIKIGDVYINIKKPWTVENEGEKKTILSNLVFLLSNISVFVSPFLPKTSEEIGNCIIKNPDNSFSVKKSGILFPRI